jgi:hypothetical protein
MIWNWEQWTCLRATQASDCPGDAEKVANIKYIKCMGMLKLSLANARSLKRVDGFITAIKRWYTSSWFGQTRWKKNARRGQKYGTTSMEHYAEKQFIGIASKLVHIVKPANPANPLRLDFYTREGVYL